MGNNRKLSGRSFIALLYPDDARYPSQRSVISSRYRFVGILHDRDIDNDGILKKPHEHIILRLPSGNPTSLLSVANSLSMDFTEVRSDDGTLLRLDGCKVQVCNSYRSSCRYLLHADDQDQYQYLVSDLFGDDFMIKDVKKFVSHNTLDEKVLELFDLIDSVHAYISRPDLARMAAGAGLYSAFRAVPSWIMEPYLESHNSHYVGFKSELPF